MGENIVVLWGGQTSIAYKGMGKGRSIHLKAEDIDYIKNSIPDVSLIGGEMDRWGVRVENNDIVLMEHVMVSMPNYEQMRYYIPEMGGRMINDLDLGTVRRRVVFLGWEIKDRLFSKEDPIGKQIIINSVPFTVVGVMKEKRVMGNYSGMDEDKLSIPLTTFETMYGDPYLDNIVYQLDDPSKSKQVEKQLFEALGAKYKFDPADDRALSTVGHD